MAYIDTRTDDLRILHSVYSSDISEYICDIANIKELKRIADISENQGVEVSRFNIFPYRYSRLDHSFGVAVILEHFEREKKQVIEAILNEIAYPSFSYSYEYLLDYFKVKDFKKPANNELISYNKIFEMNELRNTDTIEYENDALSYAKFPNLSADNLEYILSNGYLTRMCDISEIAEFYNDLIITLNEECFEEFCFTDINIAEKFFKLSIEVGKKKRSYEAKITKRLIADVLMLMIRREEISINDLFKYSDKELVDIGTKSSDKRIQEGWAEIFNLGKVYTKFNPTNDNTKYCVKVNEESMYIDPLVKTKAGVFRLSTLSKNVERDIDTYLATDTDMYMYIDYEL